MQNYPLKGGDFVGLEGLFSWIQEQVKYVLFIALFIALIVTAFQRAWIAMVGVIIGLAFVGIFIINPDVIVELGNWFSDKLRIGQS